MKFRINSAPLDLHQVSPITRRGERVLRALPDGELLDFRGLAARLNASANNVGNWGPDLPKELRVTFQRNGNRVFYGNPKTIKAFKETHGI